MSYSWLRAITHASCTHTPHGLTHPSHWPPPALSAKWMIVARPHSWSFFLGEWLPLFMFYHIHICRLHCKQLFQFPAWWTIVSSSPHSSKHLKMAHSSFLPLFSLLSLLTTIVCQTPEVVSIAYTRRDSVYHPTQVMLSCTTNTVFNHNNFFFFRNISGHIDRVIVNTSAFAQLPGRQQVMLNFDVTPELEGVYSCVNNNVTSGNSVELIGEWDLQCTIDLLFWPMGFQAISPQWYCKCVSKLAGLIM